MAIKQGLQVPVCDLGRGGAGMSTIERRLAASDGVVRVFVNPASGA